MSGKTWYTVVEATDIAVNLPDDNSPDTDIEDEDESDVESDLEDIDNLAQPESVLRVGICGRSKCTFFQRRTASSVTKLTK